MFFSNQKISWQWIYIYSDDMAKLKVWWNVGTVFRSEMISSLIDLSVIRKLKGNLKVILQGEMF